MHVTWVKPWRWLWMDEDMYKHWWSNPDTRPYMVIYSKCKRFRFVKKKKDLELCYKQLSTSDLRILQEGLKLLKELYGVSYQLHVGEDYLAFMC